MTGNIILQIPLQDAYRTFPPLQHFTGKSGQKHTALNAASMLPVKKVFFGYALLVLFQNTKVMLSQKEYKVSGDVVLMMYA